MHNYADATRQALTKVGVMTIGVVCAVLIVKNFWTSEPRMLLCEQFGTDNVATAEKIRGNQISVKIENSMDSITGIIAYAGSFSCTNIFGEGWTDARIDYD